MAESARSVALSALQRIEHEGAYANLVLPAMLSRSSLSDVDRRFVTELVDGTTRMRRACDAIVDRFVNAVLRKVAANPMSWGATRFA